MARYRDQPTGADRAKAIVAVAAIHLALAALVLSGSVHPQSGVEEPHVQLIDIALPPPPPPEPPPVQDRLTDREAGVTGKKAEASPIVAPPPKIELPPRDTLSAAPVAGTGNASIGGASTSGSGPGAGGAGNGTGGGGQGGNGIGEDARLLTGGLDRRDYRRLNRFAAPSGRAVLAILVGPDGRIAQCSVRRSSGDAGLDQELCAILAPRMRWSPARDRTGRPLTVGIYYTATWDPY